TARMTADSMTLVDAGTGYSVGDALSVAVADQTAAVIIVTDVDGAGAIQADDLAETLRSLAQRTEQAWT
ncbi:MAG: hypothetical protein ACPIA5_01750, partial [Flavobacteriales bacterium]